MLHVRGREEIAVVRRALLAEAREGLEHLRVRHDELVELLAREAQYAIMAEARDASGALTLVPDERKRAAARRDMEAARARILQALAMDAKEDGLPWPPAEENGNDR